MIGAASAPIVYRQVDRAKGLLFVFLYLGLVGAGLLTAFGFDRILDFVNSFQGGDVKALGLGVGIAVVGPVLILATWLYPKREVGFASGVTIGPPGRMPEKTIPYAEIAAMALNRTQLNALDLYDAGGRLLHRFAPYNDGEKAGEIAAAIARRIPFVVTASTRKLFGQVLDVRDYVRRAA